MKNSKRVYSGQSTRSSSQRMPPLKRIVTSQDPASSQSSRRSQPIPIIRKSDEIESDDPYDEVVKATAQYEMATWNMYALITTARRLRALNQAPCGSPIRISPLQMKRQIHDNIITVDQSRSPGCGTPFSPAVSPLHQPSLKENTCYGDIFELDPM